MAYARTRCGFTLVEMLVVLIILSVGTALMVGVAEDVRQHSRNETTRNIQAILVRALKTYKSSYGDYPAGDGKDGSSSIMLGCLQNCSRTRGELMRLPRQAIRYDRNGRQTIVDGFGREMHYSRFGGLAAKNPLLYSQGQDTDDP
ncbi:MAG TPA: type II secretion system protein, partial [Phycisphaerae bacterium]|nr:type II secretion system protein [Phycisphaerae bacterium]